ncbi:hypothetical protein JJL56_02325 [Azospirillum sp. YIM DDC1]|uniref:NrS-1 polymerase-like helicase domain-containing protein n=1 Tax=Azospirillum aestuarii TaxID=2802052 RepID=A0ABS1HS89_9PROT|nr:DUF5906 domain-containing protein [Azospirillum aestuarii]MBK4717696.1 hypothetical protein [Azospirillum aestuarii]
MTTNNYIPDTHWVTRITDLPAVEGDVEEKKDLLTRMDKINERYAVVTVGGSVGIADLSNTPLNILCESGFNTLFKNKKITVDTKQGPRERSLASIWMEWPHRREYDGGIVFAPGRTVPRNQLNLFTGFSMEPCDGCWDKMEYHLREVVCQGDERAYEWLFSWLADIVQNPGRKLGTAVCLRGRKGCGKSIVFDMFRKLIGHQYSAVISDKKHLVGSFNKHLMTALFAQCEEAVWAGSKEQEGALKHLITGERLAIEPKGLDRFEVDNFTRFAFTTNEDWALPASADERRYLILDVSDDHMQDTRYFQALTIQMENACGLEAWMKALMEWQKPDWVDLRNPPKTDALGEQVMESLPAEQRFFVDAVQTGRYFAEDRALEIFKSDIYPDYEEYVMKHGSKHAATDLRFGTALRKMWGFEHDRKRKNGSLERFYYAPKLSEVREIVAENLQVPMSFLE